jgi:hypothetical protein
MRSSESVEPGDMPRVFQTFEPLAKRLIVLGCFDLAAQFLVDFDL